MTYIAHLDVAVNQSLVGKRWREISKEIGAPLRDYEGPPGIDGICAFIRGATGLVLPYQNFLMTPELVAVIKERVAAGSPLLVSVDVGSLEVLNPFLRPYGLEGTPQAVYDELNESHPRLLELDRQANPGCFHPHGLLAGVNHLTVEGADLIHYAGNTIPILTVPKNRFLVVDQRTDFACDVDDWASSELSCLVLAPVPPRGGVLAASFSFIHDPYVGMTGIRFPGIAGNGNETLATNILRWLAGQELETVSLPATAFDYLDRIERSLVEFVWRKLKANMADWWTDGVPLTIRQKCAERCEEEGNRIPKEAYLDLVDVKAVLEKNWALFERDLWAVGWKGGKAAALSWFLDLNAIRKNVMHPTRRTFAPGLLDGSAVEQLKVLWDRVERLGVESRLVQ